MVAQDAVTAGRHTRLADSDSDEEQQHLLTLAKASDLCPKPYRLVARNQNITSLTDLSSLSALDYIDLTSNSLTSLEGIDHPRLKTLIVARNNLTQVKPIYKASTIRVLNVSENQLPNLDWLQLTTFAEHLLTLVASSNRLHSLDGLASLSSLQTLVISDNELEDITPITRLTSLVKLSASKNQIRTLPSFSPLEQLVELRLAHNRIIKLPEGRVSKLKILDMGHNRLAEIGSLNTLAPGLAQVNFGHNPVGRRDNFTEYVKGLCDRLEVLDGQRIAGGRRKLRVNRIRKAVGFDIEHARMFARMPSDYYLRRLEEKGLNEASVKKVQQDEVDKKGEIQKMKRTRADEEDDVEVETERFMEMARAKTQYGPKKGEVTVKVHGSVDGGEGKKGKKKKKQRSEDLEEREVSEIESFGDGGTSRW